MDLYNIYTESELVKKERSKLKDDDFGLPELRKFPLIDDEHVRKAIQLFNKCEEKYRPKLAKKIYEASLVYKVEISPSSSVYKYLDKDKKKHIEVGKKTTLSESSVVMNDFINYSKLSLNKETIEMFKESYKDLILLDENNVNGLLIADGDNVIGYMNYDENLNMIKELNINPLYESIGIENEFLKYNFKDNVTMKVSKDDLKLKSLLEEHNFTLINESSFFYTYKKQNSLNESNNIINPLFSRMEIINEKMDNFDKEIVDACMLLTEDNQSTKRNIYEITIGRFSGAITIDYDAKCFYIKGINYEKFLLRLKEIYQARGIMNLFEKNYSWWSQMMWEKERISSNERKIVNLKVPLFFALEIYRMFLDLSEYYKLPYYRRVARKIYEKTWVSNYETRESNNIVTDLRPLNKLNFKPKDFQKEFISKYETLKYTYDLEGYILSFDQGLGKTFTAIGLSEVLKDIKQVVIVCPNSLKENWAYEIRNYFKEFVSNKELWLDKVYVQGVKGYRFTKDTRYVITNQESIPKIYDKVKHSNVMIVVDESHNFRNIDSKRSKELLQLRKITNCKDNLLMSGTPLKATPDELVPSLRMIDPYFTEKLGVLYKKTFNIQSTEISRVVRERFDRSIYRKTKQEVLKLPEKIIDDILYPLLNWKDYTVSHLKDEINIIFKEVYEEKLKEISQLRFEFNVLVNRYSSAGKLETKKYLDYINATTQTDVTIELHEHRQMVYDNFLKEYVYPNIESKSDKDRLKYLETQYLRMRNVAMGIAIGKILPKARTEVYLDLYNYNKKDIIERIDKNLKKTIIFTPFLEVANYINEDLNKSGVGSVKVIGETKNRMEVLEDFKMNEKIDVLVATVQTLSTGVTLVESNQILFFGTPYRSADFNQACDRIHRIGQTNKCYIYKVLLSSPEKNITDRIDEILGWSEEMFDSLINTNEGNEL